MYVLAAESRALHSIDVDTGLPVSVDVSVSMLNGSKVVVKAPGLLPELSTVKEISLLNSFAEGSDVQSNEADGSAADGNSSQLSSAGDYSMVEKLKTAAAMQKERGSFNYSRPHSQYYPTTLQIQRSRSVPGARDGHSGSGWHMRSRKLVQRYSRAKFSIPPLFVKRIPPPEATKAAFETTQSFAVSTASGEAVAPGDGRYPSVSLWRGRKSLRSADNDARLVQILDFMTLPLKGAGTEMARAAASSSINSANESARRIHQDAPLQLRCALSQCAPFVNVLLLSLGSQT